VPQSLPAHMLVTKLELNTQASAYFTNITILSHYFQALHGSCALRHSTFPQKASKNITTQPPQPPHLSDNPPPHHSKNRPHLRPLSHRASSRAAKLTRSAPASDARLADHQAKLTTVFRNITHTHTRARRSAAG